MNGVKLVNNKKDYEKIEQIMKDTKELFLVS